jgi:hypothetical protein
MIQEDPKAKRATEQAVGKKILGTECPKRNRTGTICKECDRVEKLYRAGTADARDEAGSRKAKDSYFLNVQLRDGEFTALKIGKLVAKKLDAKLRKYKEKTGASFGFANIEDKGQWLSISKEGTHPNFEYDLEVLGEEAEPVDEAVVKGLPSLNNLTEDFNDGVLPLFDISSIPSGSSFEFRMVPIMTAEDRATEMVHRYYHWRCTEADILGGEDVDSVVETGDAPPKEFSEYMGIEVDDGESDAPATTEQYTMEEPPNCFGMFDNDSDCLEPDCDKIRVACANKAGYEYNGSEFVKKATKKKKAKA